MKKVPKLIRENKVFFFGEGIHKHCFYDYIGCRCPSKGEFYLSGAIIEAHRAAADLSTCYHIVKPTVQAVSVKAWTRGEKIKIGENQ